MMSVFYERTVNSLRASLVAVVAAAAAAVSSSSSSGGDSIHISTCTFAIECN